MSSKSSSATSKIIKKIQTKTNFDRNFDQDRKDFNPIEICFNQDRSVRRFDLTSQFFFKFSIITFYADHFALIFSLRKENSILSAWSKTSKLLPSLLIRSLYSILSLILCLRDLRVKWKVFSEEVIKIMRLDALYFICRDLKRQHRKASVLDLWTQDLVISSTRYAKEDASYSNRISCREIGILGI